MRGATRWSLASGEVTPISTHAPLARCDLININWQSFATISTHAPLARCDNNGHSLLWACRISTHAPLARCDHGNMIRHNHQQHFYSRTSCEVRLLHRCTGSILSAFLLTHLLRGATFGFMGKPNESSISTHAPLARCDQASRWVVPGSCRFLLTHLLRGATCICDLALHLIIFLLTHLLRGATQHQ